MVRLWSLYIEPFMRTLAPRRVMLVGAEPGDISLDLLAYCRETGCRADIIDPANSTELRAALQAYAEAHTFHTASGVKAIRAAEHPDLVLLGGDPNWSSVTNELNLLRRLSAERSQDFPCVLARQIGWPYGRRDMYARPELVEEKHPYAYQGMAPGEPGLVEFGVNASLANAAHEGGPRNGILTAIEDFVSTAPFEVRFHQLPALGGLGVLAPATRMTPALDALIEGFFSASGLLAACEELEAERLQGLVDLAMARERLERRTHALGRARELLARQQEEIAALNEKLAAAQPAKNQA